MSKVRALFSQHARTLGNYNKFPQNIYDKLVKEKEIGRGSFGIV